MLSWGIAPSTANSWTYTVGQSVSLAFPFPEREGAARERELHPWEQRAQFLDLSLGPPDGLALLWRQTSRVRPEFPRLFSLPFCRLLSSLLLFQTLLAFAFVAVETVAARWGACSCVCWGRGWSGDGGCGPERSEANRGWSPQKCLQRPCPLWELLIPHCAHLGNKLPL